MLCHVSVYSGAFCLRHRARDLISVAFFDRVALFSDFNHLFELPDQVLHPIAVVPFIYWNYAQTHFQSTHCEFYEHKALENAKFVWVTRGSKVTKPIFSNSRKRYWWKHACFYRRLADFTDFTARSCAYLFFICFPSAGKHLCIWSAQTENRFCRR